MQVVVNKVLTSYQELNPKAKKTLIILHGWAQSGQHWLSLAQKLPSEYRYILLDLPGFGQSQYLPDKPSVPEYTDFVKDFIFKLSLKKPIILGHSFGGQIAVNLAAQHPNLLSKLILISPASTRIVTSKAKMITSAAKYLKFTKKILPSFIPNFILHKLASKDYANAIGKHKEILKTIVRQDLTHQLNKITIPTHIIWGDLDNVIPYHGKLLAEEIPNSYLHVLYGADHNPHLFKTSELSQVITKILS